MKSIDLSCFRRFNGFRHEENPRFSTSAFQTSDWKLFYSAMIHSRPYSYLFSGKSISSDSKQARALAVALEIRKFEIELYWKRSAYFWVFTGAAMAGHLKVLERSDSQNAPVLLLLTSSVGLVFAFAWYLVNRASKYWQENWETHVDLLEDEIHGPLYKTVIEDIVPWWKLHKSYPFSVSKINQILSLFVVAVFALLLLNTLFRHYGLPLFSIACLALTGMALLFIVTLGQSSNEKRNKIEIPANGLSTAVKIYAESSHNQNKHDIVQAAVFSIVVPASVCMALALLVLFGKKSNKKDK